jgi:hypothetical protein
LFSREKEGSLAVVSHENVLLTFALGVSVSFLCIVERFDTVGRFTLLGSGRGNGEAVEDGREKLLMGDTGLERPVIGLAGLVIGDTLNGKSLLVGEICDPGILRIKDLPELAVMLVVAISDWKGYERCICSCCACCGLDRQS